MSEKEKKGSGGATEGSAIVLVDQTSATRVKPYKPTEIHDSDVHHKRTRAPAVPSVAEELKNLAEDTTRNENVGSTDLKDTERAMSSEHKHKASKKSSKRRDSSPDIRQASKGVDPTKDNTASKTLQQSMPSPTQPIPPQIQEEKSEASLLQSTKEAANKNAEEDSITEEIAELQTIEKTKKHSEWVNPDVTRKHGVSWNDNEYQRTVVLQWVNVEAENAEAVGCLLRQMVIGKADGNGKMDLGAKSQDWILERKASVGPCFRPGMPFEGPSGITICVPKKSSRCVPNPSGININVSRKCLTSKLKSQSMATDGNNLTYQEKRYKLTAPVKMDCEIAYAKFFHNLKGKVSTMRSKIRCAFNM